MSSNNPTVKHVPSTVVVGPHGQPVVTRGYTEIGGLRIYDDQVVVGDHGQHEISKGWSEIGGVRLDELPDQEVMNPTDGRHASDRWHDLHDDLS